MYIERPDSLACLWPPATGAGPTHHRWRAAYWRSSSRHGLAEVGNASWTCWGGKCVFKREKEFSRSHDSVKSQRWVLTQLFSKSLFEKLWLLNLRYFSMGQWENRNKHINLQKFQKIICLIGKHWARREKTSVQVPTLPLSHFWMILNSSLIESVCTPMRLA